MKTRRLLPPSLRAGLLPVTVLALLFAAAPLHAAAPPKVYRFTSTTANTTDAYMTLDHPAFNGKPTNRLIVTQYSTGVSNPRPVGVRYNHNFKKWNIFNEDFEDIPAGASFNVMIAPAAKPTSVTPQNVDAGLAFFTIQKNNPAANLLTTHMSNPIATLNGVGQPNNIGLFFIPANARPAPVGGRWAIFQENGEAHVAAVHNILDVTNLKVANTAITFRHTATAENTTDGETVITNALTDQKPDAVLFVQHLFTTGATKNVDETLGVRYSDGKWRIFSQDGDDLPVTTAYVVVAFPAVTP